MYDFHYNFIMTHVPSARLMMTDTDSTLYIMNQDPQELMRQHPEVFDMSSYPIDHPLYSTANTKVPGKFKDELNGRELMSMVGLRSKMYAFTYLVTELIVGEETRAKGVKTYVLKSTIHYEDYERVLKTKTLTRAEINMIRSYQHNIATIKQNKIALSYSDDKRYICPDGIETLPYGHYTLRIEKITTD